MPAFNFQEKFANDVESGKKRQTIRGLRKSGNAKVGVTLYLYVNQRTRKCRKLGEHECLSVEAISIDDNFCTLNGKKLDWDRVREIALADGFDGVKSFLNFFDDNYELPFDGLLIKW